MSDLDPPAQERPLGPTYVVLRFVRTRTDDEPTLEEELERFLLILPHKMRRGAEDPGRHRRYECTSVSVT